MGNRGNREIGEIGEIQETGEIEEIEEIGEIEEKGEIEEMEEIEEKFSYKIYFGFIKRVNQLKIYCNDDQID